MIHIAIMNPKSLIDKILSGEKKIESRWLKNRSAPWNKVHTGDQIYFKDSGGMVRARAIAARVQQYENDLSEPIQIMRGYESWAVGKKYCVLIWLKDAQEIMPFKIDKTGFGAGAAWLTFDKLRKIY